MSNEYDGKFDRKIIIYFCTFKLDLYIISIGSALYFRKINNVLKVN